MADAGAASVVSTPADPAGTIALAYERYAPELTVYVARSFRGRLTPEDVVHDTFTRLIREADADRLPAHVRPWLYRVAHNIAVSGLRRPAAAARSIDETPGTESVTCSAEEESETAMVSLELRMALGALPLDARTALLMVADGYSGREIAQVVGRTDLATRALLWRSRRSLRALLTAGCGLSTSPQSAANLQRSPRLKRHNGGTGKHSTVGGSSDQRSRPCQSRSA